VLNYGTECSGISVPYSKITKCGWSTNRQNMPNCASGTLAYAPNRSPRQRLISLNK